MRTFVAGKVIAAAVTAALLSVGVVVLAQPTIAAMKLRFFESWLELVYDADPSTVGYSRLARYDGDDDVVVLFADTERRGASNHYFFDTFDQGVDGADRAVQADGTAADGAAQVLNLYYTQNGNIIAYAALGAGQTITSPDMTATGLDISGDQADNEGYELVLGLYGATGRPFVVGEDPAFYTCVEVDVVDVSGTDDLRIGFRSVEQFRANFDDYLNVASIGINGTAIETETIDDNAATTTTTLAATVADNGDPMLCVFVDAAGAVTYTVNGAADANAVAFTLDDGEIVVPLIFFLHSADVAGAVTLFSWEAGFQSQRGESQ